MKDLTKGSPMRVILAFAIPVFIGNLFNLAYNLADTRIIGTYLGETALASVGSVSPLHDLLIGFVTGLANGFAVLTARSFGMKDEGRVRKCFALSITFGTLISLALAGFCYLFLPRILRLLHVEESLQEGATVYLVVTLVGLLFSLLYNVMAANLRAVGDAYTPLIFLILSASLNVALDITFVGKLGMGIFGAAIATVISQVICLVACVIYVYHRYPIFHCRPAEFLPDSSLNRSLLSGGFSMALMSCLVAFGTVSLQSAINGLGDNNIVVAHTATRKLSNIFMMPFSVMGTTMATYSGQNYGAGRIDRIKTGLRHSLLALYVWCLLCILISYTVCPYLVTAITSTTVPEIIDTAVLYQKVDTLVYFLVPTIAVLRNSLQGMGDHVTPVLSSSLEMIGKILIAFLLTPILKYWGIILAEPIVWAIMVIPLILSMRKRLKGV